MLKKLSLYLALVSVPLLAVGQAIRVIGVMLIDDEVVAVIPGQSVVGGEPHETNLVHDDRTDEGARQAILGSYSIKVNGFLPGMQRGEHADTQKSNADRSYGFSGPVHPLFARCDPLKSWCKAPTFTP